MYCINNTTIQPKRYVEQGREVPQVPQDRKRDAQWERRGSLFAKAACGSNDSSKVQDHHRMYSLNLLTVARSERQMDHGIEHATGEIQDLPVQGHGVTSIVIAPPSSWWHHSTSSRETDHRDAEVA